MSLVRFSGSLDLDKLEKKLDEALLAETTETLNEWLSNRRKKVTSDTGGSIILPPQFFDGDLEEFMSP